MNSKLVIKILIFVFLFVSITNCVKINYLNGLFEDQKCEGAHESFYGTCKKIRDCFDEFTKQKQNKGVLNVCQFDKVNENTLICCPENQEEIMTIDDIDVRIETVDSRFGESEEINSSSVMTLPLIGENKNEETTTEIVKNEENEEFLETTTNLVF
ncbi:hypothetical protein PVAND_005296 [Polypedilum vanderplanki]|uniref:Clip domain-containing protein n=1 Tax=Polypedilum vanderplanki TaxID=319348 RepID=A0A9J6BZR1_POLVA|nr:hypothetical protein PVAND_005296 [Polypedilum vanderplanki]